jgi:rhodanese-related sulfurtransferase
MPFFGRQETTPEITPNEVQGRLVRGEPMLLLDVREPAEFRESHIAGSRLIPLEQLSFRLGELPRDRPIITICRSGNRSATATTLLRRAGFDVRNMRGGMLAWHKRGFPVDRGDR